MVTLDQSMSVFFILVNLMLDLAINNDKHIYFGDIWKSNLKKLHPSQFFIIFFQQIVGPSSALQWLKKTVSLLKFFKWNVGIFTGSIEDYVPFWNIVVTCILAFINASRVICALDPLPKFSLHFFFSSQILILRGVFVENCWHLWLILRGIVVENSWYL